MKLPETKPGYLVAIVLTIIAVLFLLYASLFGSWVNRYMNNPVYDQEAQNLFDATSPFSDVEQEPQGTPEKLSAPTGAPDSKGPTYPPPSN